MSLSFNKMSCAVATCKNHNRNHEEGISFHRFPVDNSSDICKQWVIKCRRKDEINLRNARVCSTHFLPSDYEDDMQNRLLGLPLKKKLIKTAIPSQKLAGDKCTPENTVVSLLRAERSRNRAVRVSAFERLRNLSPLADDHGAAEDGLSSFKHEIQLEEVSFRESRQQCKFLFS